jgi:hypothetical protein
LRIEKKYESIKKEQAGTKGGNIMKSNNDEMFKDLKAKREQKEKDFQELLRLREEDREFDKLIHAEIEYQRLISRSEFNLRRLFVFFKLRGNQFKPRNDTHLECNAEENNPGCKYGV